MTLVRVHSVRVDINHCFMEVPVGGYETRVLLVFLFLTQITEQYLECGDRRGAGGERGGRGAGFPIISDLVKAPEAPGEDRASV